MAVSAIAMLVVPMVRPRSAAVDGRERQNIAIARERLAQLQDQIDQGALDN